MHLSITFSGGGGFAGETTSFQQNQPPRSLVTLAEAVKETLAAKARNNCRQEYVNGLRQYLAAFIRGRENTPICEIRIGELETWFRDRGEKPATRKSNAGRLAAMFQLAFRREWIPDNPCRKLESPIISHKPPVIFTVEQVEAALAFTARKKPRWLAYLALGMFAGVRPAELLRVSWDNVSFTHGTLTVDAAASKVRRRRVVHMMPCCIAWLHYAQDHGAELGTLAYMGLRRYLKRLAKHMKLAKWPQDVLRHTAASYWLAAWQDAGKVAMELGNSAGILLRHYREIVYKEQAEQFWALMPASILQTGEIKAMDAAA